MVTLLFITAVLTVVTGPLFDDWHARRRARHDFPKARVVFFLPSTLEHATVQGP